MEMARADSCFRLGSQYNQLITRRIREMGVYSELHDHEISIEEIKRMNPKGIILRWSKFSMKRGHLPSTLKFTI